MKTIVIANFKGGVGKTMTAVNMGAILAAEYGQRVLLIDADGQGNSSKMLLPPGEEYGTLTDLLEGRAICYDELTERSTIPGLDVLPADTGLWRIDMATLMGDGVMSTHTLRDLRDAVIEDGAYDYIIIDCPPAPSVAFVNAIAAANSIIIPVKVDGFSTDGMTELISQIEDVRQVHPDVHISGCLITMYYKADSVLQGADLLRSSRVVTVYDTEIRRSPKADDTTWNNRALMDWSPTSAAAKDYKAFVAEYLRKEAERDGQV